MKRGIDVSVYQGNIDWPRVKADGIEWAMVKASQGVREADYFKRNLTGARAAGLACGVYHFLTAANAAEGEAEADFLLTVIAPYQDKINLYVALDVEGSRLPTDKAALTAIVRRFYGRIEAAGFRAIVYTNPNWLRTRLEPIPELRLWLAWWRRKELVPSLADYPNLRLWQWGAERTGGIQGQVDGNYMVVEEDPDYAAEVVKRAGLTNEEQTFISCYRGAGELWQKLYKLRE